MHSTRSFYTGLWEVRHSLSLLLLTLDQSMAIISVCVLFRFGFHPADSGSVKRSVKLKNTSPCGELV